MDGGVLQCAACGRPYHAAGYLGPPMAPGVLGPGMCPPCADAVFAAERDHLAGRGRLSLAREWEAERRARPAASTHWFPQAPPAAAAFSAAARGPVRSTKASSFSPRLFNPGSPPGSLP